MRATGIVRRIDDLGRVIIPREIRRSMGIKEGDPLEIYTTEDGVVFQKYRPQAVSEVETIRNKCLDLVCPSKAEELNKLFDQIINAIKESEDD